MSRNSGARMNCTDPSPAGAIWRYLIISDALNAATVGAWASAPWNELNGFGGFPQEVCLINQGIRNKAVREVPLRAIWDSLAGTQGTSFSLPQ